MNEPTIIRRVVATSKQQVKLSKVFAREDKDGNLHPLDISTVRNYLNETRYPFPKAREVREYAVNTLGCRWQTIINE